MFITVLNKDSSYFGQKGKVVQTIPEENKLLVFFCKTELLISFNENEVGSCSQLKIPKSRKDFYKLIVEDKLKRQDLVNLCSLMMKHNLFKCSDFEELSAFVLDLNNHKTDIVDKIRADRDLGKIEFLLPNSVPCQKQNGGFSRSPKRKPFRQRQGNI